MAQLVLPLETRPALTRADFIAAPGNRAALAFVDVYPDWPAPAAALHGPAGSGKSHLVSVWTERAGARIVEAAVLSDADIHQGGALALENVDSLPADGARDRLLFALIESGVPVLFTSHAPPSEWASTMPDLASRYRALLAFALWAPDDELLGALARKLFNDRQLAVPDAVIAEMIRSLERMPGAIRDFVARADDAALSQKRPVSLALIRDLLSGR